MKTLTHWQWVEILSETPEATSEGLLSALTEAPVDPGADNLLVTATPPGGVPRGRFAAGPAVPESDLVGKVVKHWITPQEQCLIVDPAGHQGARLAGVESLLAGRYPLGEPEQVVERLQARREHLAVDLSALPPRQRTAFLARMLAGVQCLRTWTGLPRWIVLDDAQSVLADPDLPPDALRLADHGYCLVDRGAEPLPEATVDLLGLTRVVIRAEKIPSAAPATQSEG